MSKLSFRVNMNRKPAMRVTAPKLGLWLALGLASWFLLAGLFVGVLWLLDVHALGLR